MINFWSWFFKGTTGKDPSVIAPETSEAQSKAGILTYFNQWLLFHAIIGVILMLIVPIRISDAARSILLPLAGIFIGLTFAWGGNAVSLMQSEEINLLADHRPGGLREYVFKFQSAILFLLFTMVLWGLGGLNVFEFLCSSRKFDLVYNLIEILLYFLVSFSLRECWHVVMGVQAMVLYRCAINKFLKKQK